MARYDNLSFKDVDILQQLWNTYSISKKNLAKLYNISERTVNKAISGRYIVRVTGTDECDSDCRVEGDEPETGDSTGQDHRGGVASQAQTEVLPNLSVPNDKHWMESNLNHPVVENFYQYYSVEGSAPAFGPPPSVIPQDLSHIPSITDQVTKKWAKSETNQFHHEYAFRKALESYPEHILPGSKL